MNEKLDCVRNLVRAHAPLLVAYSGGVDSTCLLAIAHRTLGDSVLGIIADSPSIPRQSLADALEVARLVGVKVEVIATREFENELYVSNPPHRCYFCKAELFTMMNKLAAERSFSAIAYGENADDPPQLRPGSKAAAEFSVLAPLKQAGLNKAEVRELSRVLGLPTADLPAQPCLSSRIPHGTRVTREALAMVERGEEAVRSLGFRVFRVRYRAPAGAWVQIAPEEMQDTGSLCNKVCEVLRRAGFDSVEIDPNGYQSLSASFQLASGHRS
ncbi:MAG TPA: ATP-dependent sacrificial sulfur transferase LarE [Terrimicrobiaceae bacterium]